MHVYLTRIMMGNDIAVQNGAPSSVTTEEGRYTVNTRRIITKWNDEAARITGYPADEVIGSFCSENILVHVDENGRECCIEGCPLFDTMRDGNERTMRLYLHHRKGHRVPVSIKSAPIRSPEGAIIGAVESFTEDFNRRSIPPKIQELDHVRRMTATTQEEADTAQPSVFPDTDRMKALIDAAFTDYAQREVPFGIIRADIVSLDMISKMHGRDTAADVFKMIGRTLDANVRRNDVIGHWENGFIGIFLDISEIELKALAKKLGMLVDKSFIQRKEATIRGSISIGYALVGDEDDRDSLLERAEPGNGQTQETNAVRSAPSAAADTKQKPRRKKHRKERTEFQSPPLFSTARDYIVLVFVLFLIWLWVWFVLLH